jgi:hypothetical protein
MNNSKMDVIGIIVESQNIHPTMLIISLPWIYLPYQHSIDDKRWLTLLHMFTLALSICSSLVPTKTRISKDIYHLITDTKMYLAIMVVIL